MRIGFDAKKIVANLTGIGNYSRGTVNALATCCPGDEYLLFAPDKGNEQCRERLCLPSNTDFVYSHRTTSAGKEWWRCHGIVKDLLRCRLDVFHGLSNELPFGIGNAGCKSVVTIHDLIFLRYPQTYDWMARQILKSKTYYACCHADLIIAISQQTKRDIVRFYGISEDKIKVVYQGCDPIFYRTVGKDEKEAIRKRYGLPSCYLLCVGTLEQRKNQFSALEALTLLEKDVHLVLVSKQTKYQKMIEERGRALGLQQRVHILNNVSNPDLPALYQGALAFLYLSWFEGFGIPVLEALVSGTPVIAATGSCLEEVGGPDTLYCDPFDCHGVAAWVSELLVNNEKREQMVAAGKKYAERFSEQKIAEQLHAVYQLLIHHSS